MRFFLLIPTLLLAGATQGLGPNAHPHQRRNTRVPADSRGGGGRAPARAPRPWRLTLSDGTLTHDAHFQSVDRNEGARRVGKHYERNFIDSYRYNIAAYRLAELVGLADMMPVTIEREWDGKTGSLSWWLDDVMFDEQTRQQARNWPDDMARWSAQMSRMLLFAELVHDTDRNHGNIVYTGNWTLKMIDFTRSVPPG